MTITERWRAARRRRLVLVANLPDLQQEVDDARRRLYDTLVAHGDLGTAPVERPR